MIADAAAKLLDEVKKREPSAEAIARSSEAHSGNTRFAVNEITTAGEVDDSSITLTVQIGKRHATASINQTDDASIVALAQRTIEMTKLSPEDPEAMPVLGAQQHQPSKCYDEATHKLDPDARARAARDAIKQAEAAAVSVAGFFETSGSERHMLTSAGLRAQTMMSEASLSMTARTQDGTGSGWAGTEDFRASEIDGAAIGKTAIDKAVKSKAPKALDPGKYTVVLEPAAVGDLLSFLTGSFDARRADEGRSFFSKPGGGTRIGEKLFGDGITLASDPLDPATPGPTYDGDGLPLPARTWIDKGKLTSLSYSRFWAQKQSQQPTGSYGVYHLAGGTAGTPDDLIAQVKRGLLVTRFWYTRWLDPQTLLVTGLTRDGIYLIENGKVTSPVNNFRFNESPAVMLKNMTMMTKRTYRVAAWADAMRVPAVLTNEFTMASVSAAV